MNGPCLTVLCTKSPSWGVNLVMKLCGQSIGTHYRESIGICSQCWKDSVILWALIVAQLRQEQRECARFVHHVCELLRWQWRLCQEWDGRKIASSNQLGDQGLEGRFSWRGGCWAICKVDEMNFVNDKRWLADNQVSLVNWIGLTLFTASSSINALWWLYCCQTHSHNKPKPVRWLQLYVETHNCVARHIRTRSYLTIYNQPKGG